MSHILSTVLNNGITNELQFSLLYIYYGDSSLKAILSCPPIVSNFLEFQIWQSTRPIAHSYIEHTLDQYINYNALPAYSIVSSGNASFDGAAVIKISVGCITTVSRDVGSVRFGITINFLSF